MRPRRHGWIQMPCRITVQHLVQRTKLHSGWTPRDKPIQMVSLRRTKLQVARRPTKRNRQIRRTLRNQSIVKSQNLKRKALHTGRKRRAARLPNRFMRRTLNQMPNVDPTIQPRHRRHQDRNRFTIIQALVILQFRLRRLSNRSPGPPILHPDQAIVTMNQ